MILSCSRLDELVWRSWHIDNARVVVSRGHLTVVGPWWQAPSNWGQTTWDQGLDWGGLLNRIAPPLQFAKAGLYLSDGAILGDTNACFPARYREEVGFGALLLSEADSATGEGILSEHVSRFDFSEWNERLERQTAATGQAAADVASTVTTSREHQRLLPYDDVFRLDQHGLSEWLPLVTQQAITRAHTSDSLGQNITAVSWEPITWLQGNRWLTIPIRESQLARIHTTEATDDRQSIAEASRSGVSTSLVDLMLFRSWLTREDWSGYWNESTPLVESSHQSAT